MSAPGPSPVRRLLGTAAAIVVGILIFTVLTRLTDASIAVTIGGAVVIAVVGILSAVLTPRRRRRRQQLEQEQR